MDAELTPQARLVAATRALHAQGWMQATSGNASVVLRRAPLELAITRSGADKGCLAERDLVRVDARGERLAGEGRPSGETAVHLALVRAREAGAVLHTHSVWATVLSERGAGAGGVELAGYAMLGALAGQAERGAREPREILPVVEASRDPLALARSIEAVLRHHPGAHGVLVRRHGLFTWGADLEQARRHVEALEFLLEVAGRLGA